MWLNFFTWSGHSNEISLHSQVPTPQYPLYSATIAEFGMQQVGYYLNEETNWGLDIPELERALEESKQNCYPRAIVVINPGNPTGQVLTRDNIQNIIKFAHENHLFIFADEVYQDNVYEKESTFHSFKKVLFQMGEPYKSMELASFMSCSKGYMGMIWMSFLSLGPTSLMINICYF